MRNVTKKDEDILSSVISTFIKTGKPVGSKTLSEDLNKKVSSATIRNVMASLEQKGLLTHLHTSGGRVPTDQGIRYYIDYLLQLSELSEKEFTDIKSKYSENLYNVSDIFKKTSKMLSMLSNCAGLVVAPNMKEMFIKQMEFIQISSSQILAIFVGRDGIVENRIIKTEDDFTYSDLEKINNYCNRAFYGLTIRAAISKLNKEIKVVQREYDKLISSALMLSKELFSNLEKRDLFVEGGTTLMKHEFADFDNMAAIIETLEDKKRLIDLFNRIWKSESVNIFIGAESGYSDISKCSVVTSSYKKNGKMLGMLGVIGPMRMDYSKVIPIVDCTAKLVGEFLDGKGVCNDEKRTF